MILQSIKKVFSFKGIAIILLASLIGTLLFYKQEVRVLTNQNTVLNNNNKAYEQELIGLSDSIENARITYELTIRELNKSKDRVLENLNKAREALGIKDNEIKELRYFKSTVNLDTTIIITINENCEFKERIEYNPQTIFNISILKNDSNTVLKHSADISGSFKAYSYEQSEWKESNFFKRLFLFRWGKYRYENNILSSDNDKIRIKDFKVVRIIE